MLREDVCPRFYCEVYIVVFISSASLSPLFHWELAYHWASTAADRLMSSTVCLHQQPVFTTQATQCPLVFCVQCCHCIDSNALFSFFSTRKLPWQLKTFFREINSPFINRLMSFVYHLISWWANWMTGTNGWPHHRMRLIRTFALGRRHFAIVGDEKFGHSYASVKSVAHGEIKQNCRRSGLRFSPSTVDSFVLFQFQWCADAWNKADHRQHCLTAVLFQTSAHSWNWNTETVSPCWKIC